jgi:hypothetical protein
MQRPCQRLDISFIEAPIEMEEQSPFTQGGHSQKEARVRDQIAGRSLFYGDAITRKLHRWSISRPLQCLLVSTALPCQCSTPGRSGRCFSRCCRKNAEQRRASYVCSRKASPCVAVHCARHINHNINSLPLEILAQAIISQSF